MQQDLQASHLACLNTAPCQNSCLLTLIIRLGFFHTANLQSKGILETTIYKFLKSKGLLFHVLGEKQHDQEQKLL